MAKEKREGITSTQVRLSKDIKEYMEQESKRLDMTQSAFMTMLLEQGRIAWECYKNSPEKLLKNN